MMVTLQHGYDDKMTVINQKYVGIPLKGPNTAKQVNKALPRVEQELESLIADWERLHQVLVQGFMNVDNFMTPEHV